jgi:hypothetical protein
MNARIKHETSDEDIDDLKTPSPQAQRDQPSPPPLITE